MQSPPPQSSGACRKGEDAVGGACSDRKTGGQLLKARVAPGVELIEDPEGLLELQLSKPVGSGSMRGRALSRGLFIALVDFACTRCPNIPSDTPLQLPSFSSGMWLTVNLCWEGRCEVDIPDGGLGVVAAGDLCASYSRRRPAEFRYPSGRYRGVELFVNDRVAEEPAFSLLGKGDNAIRRIAREAGPAAVLTGDAELNGRMERLAALLDENDGAMANTRSSDCCSASNGATFQRRNHASCSRARRWRWQRQPATRWSARSARVTTPEQWLPPSA